MKPLPYSTEYELAWDRGYDDATEGLPMDERNRSRTGVAAWNGTMWNRYRAGWLAGLESQQGPGCDIHEANPNGYQSC